MRLRLLATAAFALSTLFAARARAETTAPSDPTASHAIEVNASPVVFAMHGSHTPLYDTGLFATWDPYVGGQLAIGYRSTPKLSLGAIGSYVSSLGEGGRLLRFTGEARYHAVRGRFGDLWGAGEAGLAAAWLVPPGCGDCGEVPPEQQRTRFAPLVGIGIGADFLPVPYFSIGIEGRALVALFDGMTPQRGHVPQNVAPGAMMAITLGLHVPLAE
jgi:hypothetical protein